MSEPDFLSRSRIAILGLGLMGGSLALALQGRCRALVACDPDADTVAMARERNIVDEVSTYPADILPGADVIVLAAPVQAILALIEQLPWLHSGPAMVLDLGSTKRQIVKAMETLPPRFDPLGGHPMCGKESSGLANAAASIFEGATFAFTPLSRTSKNMRAFAEQLARSIGSNSLWMDPETHDRWAAATSHLPYLLAAALVLATPREAAPLVGPGYRSTTRVAATPTAIMLDVLATNQDNILAIMSQFRRQMDYLQEKLANGGIDALEQALNQSAEQQRDLII